MLIIEPTSSSQNKIGIIMNVVKDLVMCVWSFLPVVMNQRNVACSSLVLNSTFYQYQFLCTM